ncbi:augurin-A isoform X2 [Oncorhynchus mykiss]|uniref:augurin-A isoform X2 n=1 Tax=Oncorhynchus mykiss TaxID=8022 RepID=UPI001877E57C|nr:augurin-A isoform X2 [Oncorhynchus mykiss]XP_036808186.1 augurin-A isoform X2 [Oncorhynchus mykiss]
MTVRGLRKQPEKMAKLRESSGTETETMAFHNLCLQVLLLTAFLSYCAHSDGTAESKLHRLLKKRDVGGGMKPVGVAMTPSKAKEFLTSLRRPKRNIWDRSRPDVQQWIMQFMHMGYDEARLETDLSYWMDLARSSDQGRQHHYDENAPIGPQDPDSYRHGANVNYDYY